MQSLDDILLPIHFKGSQYTAAHFDRFAREHQRGSQKDRLSGQAQDDAREREFNGNLPVPRFADTHVGQRSLPNY